MKRSLLFFIALALSGITAVSCSKASASSDGVNLNIPFSHKTHVENYDIKDCGTCHKYSINGEFQGLPTVGDCTACHMRNAELVTNDHKIPRKKTMFDSYADKDKLWKSKAQNPDLLYYSHKIKMSTSITDSRTKVRCDLCHADKAVSTGNAKTSGGKLMDQCLYCHNSFKLNDRCDVCHR